jgi:hypothetical protein
MISFETVRIIALSFPETDEYLHFHLPAFRVKKKIFCTIHKKDNRIMVKLSAKDQSVFCSFDQGIIYPVPGGWGRRGATFIELGSIKKAMLKDAITMAFCNTAPPALAEKFYPR